MRSSSNLLVLGGLALAAFFSGCGDGGGGGGGSGGGGGGGGGDAEALCVALCEEQEAKGCSSVSDCAVECADDAARNDETGCTPQYLALFQCFDDLPDICEDDSGCEAELEAYWICVG